MDRLIAPNTVPFGSHDTAPSTGTPAMATDGNPALGIPPTIWPAYGWNMLEEEIRAVVTAGNVTPDRNNWAQLLQALRALFMARGNTTGNQVAQIFTPTTGGGSRTNVFTFTPAVSGTFHVIGSVNLGAPGQQPTGCTNQVAVNGTLVSSDSTSGAMCNHGVAIVAAGTACTIQQTYAWPPGVSGFCSTSLVLSYIFVPN